MRIENLALLVWMMLAVIGFGLAGDRGAPAEYIGGTLEGLPDGVPGVVRTNDPNSFIFQAKRVTVRVPYERINLIEYGQKVDRRLLEAIIISPLLAMSRKRAHYVTVGYEGEDGRQQAMLLRVDKKAVRVVLVSLEARTGRKVTYMDEEARKAGKG